MRYKVVVSYDGTNYFGSQRQSNHNTIQEEIEYAIERMTRIFHRITMCSRTDKGVHSNGQVFHFDSDLPIAIKDWKIGINKRLPLDIRVKKVEKVSNDFHARYSAKSKEYHYWFHKKELTAFNQNYFVYEPNIDFSAINSILNVFVGTHDFVSFTPKTTKETIKTVYSITMKEYKDRVCFIFHGEGFLKYMIRSIMGNLVDYGLGRKNKEDLELMLKNNLRTKSSKTMRASGLYLHKINY